MNEFLSLTLNIFILAVITAIIESLIPNNKMVAYIKPIICIAVLLTVVTYVSNINLSTDIDFNINDYDINIDEVWKAQEINCEKILSQKILKDCKAYNINVSDIIVDIEHNSNEFKIKNVYVYGAEKNYAKNYISGKYNIGLAYIITDGD